ncbi:MAG: radical SAM protein, partial [Pygmaiobacter sp.]
MSMVKITSLTEPLLLDYIQGLGQPAFRGKQIYKWLHQKQVAQWSEMTDIPKSLLETLSACAEIETLAVSQQQRSKDGTIKYLFRLPDGNCIESVVMRYSYGNTLCVSTEVGCAMGCRFCASTQGGLVRRLTAGEICAEVYTAQKEIGERISNVVLMGIGEPLDNYDNVVDFLRIISSANGINIG